MSNTDLRICLAGCGRMGAPMLAALHEAGLSATGFDIRDPDSYGPLGYLVRNDPTQIPQDTNILITVVRDIPQTEDLLFKKQQLLKRLPNLSQLVISSTLSPNYITALEHRTTIPVIDAPMSGATIAAQEKRLSFMLGGDAKDIAHIQPALAAMGTHFHHMGKTGAGMSAKVLNNLLAASNTAMTRLVLDWADHLGLDEAELLSLIHTSSGQNWLASGFDVIEFARDGFDPENTIGILKKDVESALDASPPGADTSLPDQIIKSISGLSPRPLKR